MGSTAMNEFVVECNGVQNKSSSLAGNYLQTNKQKNKANEVRFIPISDEEAAAAAAAI